MTRRIVGVSGDARARWYKTHTALVRFRKDLQAYGVGFTWREIPARLLDGTPAKLIGMLSGQIDNQKRKSKDADGNQSVIGSQHSGYQDAAFALTLLQPFFPFATIVGGGVAPNGSWKCQVWLDCSEAECKRLEAAAAETGP